MSDSAELLRFLAHALELEADAANRYEEQAEALQVHNNPAIAAFFTQMAEESARHLSEVEALIANRALPEIPPWDFDWRREAPESASHEALHYRMSLRDALTLALSNERSAQAFYAGYAEASGDPEVVALARQFAEEEDEHARLLEERLAGCPEEPRYLRQDDDQPHMPE